MMSYLLLSLRTGNIQKHVFEDSAREGNDDD